MTLFQEMIFKVCLLCKFYFAYFTLNCGHDDSLSFIKVILFVKIQGFFILELQKANTACHCFGQLCSKRLSPSEKYLLV